MSREVFHAGEQAVQRRVGVREEIGPWAQKVVRAELPDQHRAFYAGLPFVVLAARDASGRPWATILTGPTGFLDSPDPEHLRIRARPAPGDALEGSLAAGAEIGLLGIELATRRRNRANGRVIGVDEDPTAGAGSLIAISQSFGNCPQYIQPRGWRWVGETGISTRATRSDRLSPRMQDRIRRADTFFIATGHTDPRNDWASGMDASHRGGPVGFVEVRDARTLVFPDYPGNNHFNTIGNLEADGRAGLLFVDFETGGLLQLTGRASVEWIGEGHRERSVHFELDQAIDQPSVLPLRFDSEGQAARSLRVVERTRESEDVVSFRLRARDGGRLPDFEPGQHLPIELSAGDEAQPIRRTYSLSNGPGQDHYRISVKREEHGLASQRLHDSLEVGDFVEALTPAGEFILHPGTRPLLMIGGGIGVTPLISMLSDWVRRKDPRRLLFVQVARDGRHHPLAREIRSLTARFEHGKAHVIYTRPGPEDRVGVDFDTAGRPERERLAALLPTADVDAYLCGPVPFMRAIQETLESLGVDPTHIHSESFGPSGR